MLITMDTIFNESYSPAGGIQMEEIPAATKELIVVSGNVTTIYHAVAKAGTAENIAGWRAYKKVVDESITNSTAIKVTWADGNTNFDNIVTDLTLLNYS